MHRPLACSSCLFPCCLQSIEVSAPPGNVIGTIEQEWSICSPSFRILNHLGDTVMRIEGPFCTFSLCGDVEFNVCVGYPFISTISYGYFLYFRLFRSRAKR